MMAFVRSLISWQRAVFHAHPEGLFALVDLEEAAVDPLVAQAWVAFLDQLARARSQVLVELQGALGPDDYAVTKTRTVLDALEEARRHAEQHATQMGRERSDRR